MAGNEKIPPSGSDAGDEDHIEVIPLGMPVDNATFEQLKEEAKKPQNHSEKGAQDKG